MPQGGIGPDGPLASGSANAATMSRMPVIVIDTLNPGVRAKDSRRRYSSRVTSKIRVALTLALLVCACANPTKLARQSSIALAKGETRKAYEKARSGIEKDPQHSGARDAYRTASQALAIDYRARVVAMAAATDTIPAADLALEFAEFRREVGAHGTMLDSVPEYNFAEGRIVRGAARAYYKRGADAMAARRPRIAVTEFTRTRHYVSNFEDVVTRLAQARREATVRVAVFPFTDRIGVPGLSHEMADTIQRELAQRIPGELEFTQLVSAADIDRNMTVAELRTMFRQDAIALGSRIGADWIVVGTYRGLSTQVSQKTTRVQLYERVDRKDSSIIATTRWEEITVPIVNRRRDVGLQVTFDVIEVATGTVLGSSEANLSAVARVTWTDFVAAPPFDRYALVSPDLRRIDPERAKTAEKEWKAAMGVWEVDDFLKHTREQRSRSRYASRYRGEFYRNTRETPVWLGELPGENEMVFVAVRDVWRGVLAKLKELDKSN